MKECTRSGTSPRRGCDLVSVELRILAAVLISVSSALHTTRYRLLWQQITLLAFLRFLQVLQVPSTQLTSKFTLLKVPQGIYSYIYQVPQFLSTRPSSQVYPPQVSTGIHSSSATLPSLPCPCFPRYSLAYRQSTPVYPPKVYSGSLPSQFTPAVYPPSLLPQFTLPQFTLPVYPFSLPSQFTPPVYSPQFTLPSLLPKFTLPSLLPLFTLPVYLTLVYLPPVYAPSLPYPSFQFTSPSLLPQFTPSVYPPS